MRQMLNRVQPVVQNTVNANIAIQRRDRDLLIIVLAEVIMYVITTLLLPLIQLEMMITGYVIPNRSSQYSQIEYFILSIAYFLLSVNSAAPFYTYLVSSKSFRRDFNHLIINGYRKLSGQPPVEAFSRTNRTLVQQETRI
jgi:predicted permease